MCIAIFNRAKTILTKHTIDNCWRRNKDGAGVLYALDGKLHVFKAMGKKSFTKGYNKIREAHPDIDLVVHFRFSTHGSNNLLNTHPHIVSEEVGFVHNGVLDNVVDDNERDVEYWSKKEKKLMKVKKFFSMKSDSGLFAEMLSELPKDFMHDAVMMELIANYVEKDNKLIFLDRLGNYKIVNEDKGVWDSGCWFSNTGYLQAKEVKKEEPKQIGFKYWGWGQDEADEEDKVEKEVDILSGNTFDHDTKTWKQNTGYCCEPDYVECDYCMARCSTNQEKVNKTCNDCYKYFLDEGGYG